MRILFISNHYPPYEVGGYEQLCRDVADRLAARGHAIRVLTTTFGLERSLHTNDESIQRVLRFVPDYDAKLSAGLLVIGSEVGGQIEMMQHGQNALTYPAGNAVALANEIEVALNDPALRARLARAGQALILERFTLQRMVADFEAWLNDLTV